jgi:gentisate 1,2-dioxygenase
MLRPGQALALPVRSPAMVFHVIEGGLQAVVAEGAEAQAFNLAEADTCCAPGFTPVLLRNASAAQPAFIFIADETPLHQKLGVFETRG